MKKNNQKSNLDEHQELVLLKIEHNGCWFAFWGLLAAMAIQMFINGNDMKNLAGEWVVFMCLALYLAGACLKNGIWDRKLKANAVTNLVCSLIAGAAMGIFNFLLILKRYPDKIAGSIASGVFIGIFTFVLVFAVLQIFMVSYKKRRKALEEEPEDERS